MWPGNIRELQSVLRQALLDASSSNVLPAMFLPDLAARPPAPSGSFDLERFIHDRIDTAAGGFKRFAAARARRDRRRHAPARCSARDHRSFQYGSNATTGDHAGDGASGGGPSAAYGPAAYTIRPPTTVSCDSMRGIAASGTVK